MRFRTCWVMIGVSRLVTAGSPLPFHFPRSYICRLSDSGLKKHIIHKLNYRPIWILTDTANPEGIACSVAVNLGDKRKALLAIFRTPEAYIIHKLKHRPIWILTDRWCSLVTQQIPRVLHALQCILVTKGRRCWPHLP